MKSLLIYIGSFLLYNRKENVILELDISYLADMLYMIAMSYMIDMLYMSYQHCMYYQDDMLLYVYDTILSIYTFIFMFHVKHLYVAPYNCIYNCILFLDMISV